MKYSDSQLISLAQNGSSAACNELAERYLKQVKKIAKKFFFPGYTEFDVLQEAGLGLSKAIRTYNPEKNDNFGAYVNLCVTSYLSTLTQKVMRQKRAIEKLTVSIDAPIGCEEDGDTYHSVIPSNVPSPEELYLRKERRHETLALLEKSLSPLERQVFSLRARDYSYDEIARLLNISNRAVDNAYQRCRKKLLAAG